MFTRKLVLVIPVLAAVAVLAFAAGVAGAQEPRPFLGVAVAEDPAGAVVEQLLPEGPAAEAGVEIGDIITAVNGEPVTAASLADVISGFGVGDVVALELQRGDETLTLDVPLGDLRAFETAVPPVQLQPEQPVQPLPPMIRGAFLGVTLETTEEGVVIGDVVAGSPAEAAGLQAGDLITAIDGEAVSDASAVAALVRSMEPGAEVAVELSRDGETRTATVVLGETPGPRGVPLGMHRDVIIYDEMTQVWRVLALSETSPLYAAGVRPGDVITAVDEQTAPEGLGAHLEELEDDATVTLIVERGDETIEVEAPAASVEVLLMPFTGFRRGGMDSPFDPGMMPMMGMPQARLGVSFVTLTAEVAEERGVEETEGAFITAVEPESPAAEAGLRENDIVVSVDGDVVDEERTLRDRLLAYEPDDAVTLGVVRDGETLELEVTLDQATMPMFGGMPFEMPGFQMPMFPHHELGPDLMVPLPEATPPGPVA